MKISVIITEYNRRGFLKDALSSILNQSLDKDKYENCDYQKRRRQDDRWLCENGRSKSYI